MAADGVPDDGSNKKREAEGERRKKKRKRWGSKQQQDGDQQAAGAGAGAASTAAAAAGATAGAAVGARSNSQGADAAKAKVLAMQESIRARLAAAKAKQQQKQQPGTAAAPPGAAAGAKRPAGDYAADAPDNKKKRARHFELDMSVTGPTFQRQQQLKDGGAGGAAAAAQKKKPKINPYLAHRHVQEEEGKPSSVAAKAAAGEDGLDIATAAASDETPGSAGPPGDDFDDVDARLEQVVTAKAARPHRRALKFVEPGTWQQIADQKREKAAKAEASGYVSGRKAGHTIQSASMADVYGPSRGGGDGGESQDPLLAELPFRADADPDRPMPLIMEWWDTALLPAKLRKEVANNEASLLVKQSKKAMQKLAPVDNDKPAPGPTAEGEDNEGASPAAGNRNEDDSAGLGADVATQDLRNRCYEQAALAYSKTAALVQHIVPIQPRKKAELKPVLHLTKREMKRQRKMRRQEKQRELQDMQAAGLLPAPEPRLTLKNFIRVLGDQAYLDPSQMEQKVMEQMQARQRAHLERNASNKLTKEQRAEKRARKMQKEDANAAGVAVALFWVADMSHPYHRTKVDLNAQQNYVTGGVLECENPKMALVVCEGGPKAIKRYRRLMEVRMKWTGPDDQPDDDEEEDESGDQDAEGGEANKEATRKFNPNNECHLVWSGMAVKRNFNSFLFQSCETADQARKVLKAKGVAHYWDQILEFHTGRKNRGQNLHLRLAAEDDEEEDEGSYDGGDDGSKDEDMEDDEQGGGDVVMADATG